MGGGLKVEVRNPQIFDMRGRMQQLRAGERRAATKAATRATDVTRSSFKYVTPAVARPRPGRSSTGGKLASIAKWSPDLRGGVAFNRNEMDIKARHWIINEIGSGSTARVRQPGMTYRKGRMSNSDPDRVAVRSQIGRYISRRFVFANASNNYVAPGRRRDSTLEYADSVKGVPFRRAQIRIKREIRPKNFVKKGGREGYRTYRNSLIAEARQAFQGQAFR